MTYILTKADVQAVRAADILCFDHYEGKDDIRAIVEAKTNRAGWVKPKQELEIPVDAKFVSYNNAPYGWKPAKCFAYCSVYRNNQRDDVTATFADFLKPGDSICLLWTTSRGNGYLEGAKSTIDGTCYDAPLYHDKLHATVWRKDKHYTFLLESTICVNNSAKMIRER